MCECVTVGRQARCFNNLNTRVVLQVNDIQRPLQYERAIKEKESAREEIEVTALLLQHCLVSLRSDGHKI